MNNKTLTSYVTGFVVSLVLTFAAYIAVANHIASPVVILATIFTLAILQMLIQLIFFLHLGQNDKGHWNVIVLLGTVAGIVVFVLGTLWIINNLNYRMTPQQMEKYVQSQDGF